MILSNKKLLLTPARPRRDGVPILRNQYKWVVRSWLFGIRNFHHRAHQTTVWWRASDTGFTEVASNFERITPPFVPSSAAPGTPTSVRMADDPVGDLTGGSSNHYRPWPALRSRRVLHPKCMLLLIAAGCMGDHSQCAEMKNAQRPAHRRLRRLGPAKRSDHALIFTRDSACCCQRSVRGSSS
jgi:hypothetical protein